MESKKKMNLEIKEKIVIVEMVEDNIMIDNKTEVIFHMADVHICKTKNVDVYDKILKKTVEIIKNEKREKLTVICGDLFEERKPNQVANIMARTFLKELGNVCETILILGNHDKNMNNDNEDIAPNSTKTILCALETKYKIHLLTDENVHKIKGINFVLTDMKSKKVSDFKKNKNEVYISLYHGTINNSKIDNHIFVDNKKLGVKDFAKYDYVFLGDIHKHQYFRKNKTMCYPGSLVQQDFGESVDHHGMILWDMNNKTSKFIEVPNEQVYKTHVINSIEDTEIPDIEGKKCRLRIKHKKLTIKELDFYEEIIKKKYEIIEYYTKTIENDVVTTTNDTNEKVSDRDFIDIYKDYLISEGLEEEEIVTKTLERLVSEKKKIYIEDKKEIKIKSIEFENLLMYGTKNKINFENMNGINLLLGKNKIGKSSIIDIILFTIYGECSKGKNILRLDCTNGKSELVIESNGITYRILRIITDRTILKIFEEQHQKDSDTIVAKELFVDISDNHKVDVQGQIIMMFGTYQNMISTSIILQHKNDIMDPKNKNRIEIFNVVYGTEIYNDIYNECDFQKRSHSNKITGNLEKNIEKTNYDELIDKEINILEIHKKELKNTKIKEKNILKEKTLLEIGYGGNFDDINDLNIEKIELANYQENLKNKIANLNYTYDVSLKHKTENNVKKLQLEIETLNKKKVNINADEIENLEKMKYDLEQKIFRINNEFTEKKDELNYIIITNNNILKHFDIYDKNVYDAINECNITEKKLTENINEYNYLNKIYENEKNNNKTLLEHEFSDKCKFCKKNQEIHKLLGFHDKIEKIQKRIEELGSIDENNDKLEDLSTKLLILNKYIDNKNTIEKMNLHIDFLTTKIELHNNNINHIMKNIDEIKLNNLIAEEVNELEIKLAHEQDIIEKIIQYEKMTLEHSNNILELEKIDAKISKYYNSANVNKYEEILKSENDVENELNKINKLITEINSNIAKYEINKINQISKIEEVVKAKNNIYPYLKILEYCNGNFYKFIIKRKNEILERKINEMILPLADYEIKITMVNNSPHFLKIIKKEEAYKKINKTKNKIFDNVNNKIYSTVEMIAMSGFERVVFDLCLRLALNNMNLIKNNFIIIDEGFSAADSENVHKFQQLLEIIKKEYKICIIISHIEEIKNQEGNVITIQYDPINHESKINV